MKQPLISIIVPVFNTEKYLQRCINSLLNQTLKDIEIILVDDGSTDNSRAIIQRYATLDSRISTIYSENEGQGAARNKGLSIAQGKYIGFIDSDDWVDEGLYLSMVNTAEANDCDMVVCGRKNISETGDISRLIELDNHVINTSTIKSKEIYIVDLLFYTHTVSCCNKIYKSMKIKENSIKFHDTYEVGSEDLLFNFSYLYSCDSIAEISTYFYNNLERNGSTTRRYNRGYFKRLANLTERLEEREKKNKKIISLKHIAPLIIVFYYQWGIGQIKNYSTENVTGILHSELNCVQGCKIFKKYLFLTAIDISNLNYFYRINFTFKGAMLLKLIFLLIALNFNKAAMMFIVKYQMDL